MWGKSLGQLQTPSINHPACLSTDVGAAVTVRSKCARTWALHTSANGEWCFQLVSASTNLFMWWRDGTKGEQYWHKFLSFILHHSFYINLITFWRSIHIETRFYPVKTELFEGTLQSGYIWKCCFQIVVLSVKMEVFKYFARLKNVFEN